MEPYIETASGRKFWYNTDSIDGICIDDIGAALSKLCRFTGHCREFYSVAEHSVYVSYLVPKDLALAGLLHDASEAYLSDIASPIKQFMPEYKNIENDIMKRIALKFSLPEGFHEGKEVKQADWAQLKSEAQALLPTGGKEWFFPEGLPNGIQPGCEYPNVAEDMFKARFYELT